LVLELRANRHESNFEIVVASVLGSRGSVKSDRASSATERRLAPRPVINVDRRTETECCNAMLH
jgi:hypothetical protein